MKEKNSTSHKDRGILYLILIILILLLSFSIFSFWITYKTLSKIEVVGELKKDIEKLSTSISKAKTAPEQPLPPLMPPLSPGDPAPIVNLPDIKGEKISTAKYRGEKKLLLYAWMPGCSHCEVLTPKLLEFANKHRNKKFAVLTITRVAYEEEVQGIKDYVKKKNINLPVMISTPQDSFGMDYRVSRVPTLWVISEDLKIIATYEGEEIGKEDLESVLLKKL